MQLHRGTFPSNHLEDGSLTFFIIEQTEHFHLTGQKTVIFLAGQVPGLAALQAWE